MCNAPAPPALRVFSGKCDPRSPRSSPSRTHHPPNCEIRVEALSRLLSQKWDKSPAATTEPNISNHFSCIAKRARIRIPVQSSIARESERVLAHLAFCPAEQSEEPASVQFNETLVSGTCWCSSSPIIVQSLTFR